MHKMWYWFYEGLCSLWYWLPVIWQDRDYDYCFTLYVLHHSLKRLELGMHRWHNTRHSRMRELKTAVLLLDRITDGDYSKVCRRLDEPEYDDLLGKNEIDFSDWRKIEQSDWDYLWPLLQKWLRYWWD